MRQIGCFDVQQENEACTFSLSDRNGTLLYSVPSKNEEWRNIRMHVLSECVMRNRITSSRWDLGSGGPAALLCQDPEGFRMRFFSALGNELAYTSVCATQTECMAVYERIRTVLKKEHVTTKFYR